MALIFRTFWSRREREHELTASLRQAAWEMLQSGPGSVVICRSHDPREIVWVGDRGSDSEFSQLPLGIDLSGSCDEDARARCWPTLSLRFVDEWYRFPAPPYQVWNFAVRMEGARQLETPRELLALPSGGKLGSHVVGRSLYSATSDRPLLIGFVGLSLGWLGHDGVGRPTVVERVEGTVTWRPLSIVHRIERAPGGSTRTTGGRHVAEAPFWPRSLTFRAHSMPGANSEEIPIAAERARPG